MSRDNGRIIIDDRAERDAIHHLLFSRGARQGIFAALGVRDFADRACTHFYDALLKAHRVGVTLDDPGIRAQIKGDKKMKSVLSRKFSGIPAADCIVRLKRTAVRRQAAEHLILIDTIIDDPAATEGDLASGCSALMEIFTGRGQQNGQSLDSICEAVKVDFAAALRGESTYIPWRIGPLDRLAPMLSGNLVCVGARPRTGKTALAVSAINEWLAYGKAAGLICFEMTAKDIVLRIASQRCRTSFREIKSGMRGHAEHRHRHFANALESVRNAPLQLACGEYMTLGEIRAEAQAWRKKGIGILFVDYLQNIIHNEAPRRHEAIAATGRFLKGLANDLAIPVVILAQLNREAENTIPQIHHLGESSGIEADSDIIVLLDRPDINGPAGKDRSYRDRDGKDIDMTGQSAAIVVKNRNGETGMGFMAFDGPLMRFAE